MRVTLVAVLTCLTLSACGPQTSPGAPRAIAAPPKAAPVSTAPVEASVGRVSRSVEVVAREAVAARDSMARAKASADEARKLTDAKNAALLAAIDDVLKQLDEAAASQKGLLAEVETLRTERDTLAKETQLLNASVTAKESEAAGLRQSLDQANATIGDAGTTIQSLNGANESLIKQSASAGVYKHWVIGLIFAGLVYIALKLYRIVP